MTTYRDQFANCAACGKDFVYRVEEQRQQDLLGFDLTPPENCPKCQTATPLGPGLHAGAIKWYREDKHFGFLVQSNGSEIFFHHSGVEEALVAQLQEGTPVWYEITDTDRGPQAINVHARE